MAKDKQPKDIKFPARKNAHPDGWKGNRTEVDKAAADQRETRPPDTEHGWPLGNRWLD